MRSGSVAIPIAEATCTAHPMLAAVCHKRDVERNWEGGGNLNALVRLQEQFKAQYLFSGNAKLQSQKVIEGQHEGYASQHVSTETLADVLKER